MPINFIYISYELAKLIRSQCSLSLKSYYEDPRIFLKEELEQVTSLTITQCHNIDDLEKLPNLSKLIIYNPPLKSILDESQFYRTMNQIQDFEVIGKLKKLTHLEIDNDFNITSLNLENLTKLRVLLLHDNRELNHIYGLSKLKKLRIIQCSGCTPYFGADFDPLEYIQNTRPAIFNILDITSYPYFLNAFRTHDNFCQNVIKSGSKLKFAESIALFQEFVYSYGMLDEVIQETEKILKSSTYWTSDGFIDEMYKHVITETMFDYDGLRERNRVLQKKKISNLTPREVVRFSSIHSTYNCLVQHKSNCEGMVNALRFLLSIGGVQSYNIHCSIKAKTYSDKDINHAILKVQKKDGEYYYDPAEESIHYHECYEPCLNMIWAEQDYETVLSTYNLNETEKKLQKKREI